VVQRRDYDEFGVVADVLLPDSTLVLPFGFAGGLYDGDTGLVRFGARDYDAETGRWLAKDPRLLRGGVNLYVYVGDDPVGLIDPTGQGPEVVVVLCNPVFLLYTAGALLAAAIIYDVVTDLPKPTPANDKAICPKVGEYIKMFPGGSWRMCQYDCPDGPRTIVNLDMEPCAEAVAQ
jgi:RHS repeat-associated protein